MRKLIKKIKASIQSRREAQEELTELQLKRINVCKSCPFNSDNKKVKTFKDLSFIFLNKILNIIFRVKVSEDAVCTDCGCNIIFKSTQTDKDLICQQNKWNNL